MIYKYGRSIISQLVRGEVRLVLCGERGGEERRRREIVPGPDWVWRSSSSLSYTNTKRRAAQRHGDKGTWLVHLIIIHSVTLQATHPTIWITDIIYNTCTDCYYTTC